MIADRFGWTFDEIGDLTYPQMCAVERYIKEYPVQYTMSVVPKDK